MRLINAMRGAAAIALAAVMLAPASFAKDKKDKKEDKPPMAWGMNSGNAGCVIFGESEQTTSEMNGPNGFTTHTVKVLEVVDAINAKLPKKKYEETKANLDKLESLSMQNHLKYVNIPKKHKPEELEQAKAMCGK